MKHTLILLALMNVAAFAAEKLTLVHPLEEDGTVYGAPGWCHVAAAYGEFKIAFCERLQNADGSWADGDVFLVNPDGSGLMNLTNSPAIYELAVAWSPDGRRLAVGHSHQTDHRLLVYSLDEDGTAIVGTEEVTDSGPLAGRQVNSPRWAKTRDEVVVEADMHLWVIQLSNPYAPRQIRTLIASRSCAPTGRKTTARLCTRHESARAAPDGRAPTTSGAG